MCIVICLRTIEPRGVTMEWLPSISTTAILALLLWLARNLIATRLTKSVQHEFDTKLESLRTELRKNEEVFRTDLRAKETEIAILRSGAMTAMASRQVALDKRRLDAIDQLWSAFIALGPAKEISVSMSVFNIDKVFERDPFEDKLREAFKQFGVGFDETKFDFSVSEKARPFVSPMSWALFTAYQAIVFQAVAKLRLIQLGFGMELLDKDDIKKLVKAALPEYEAYIEKHGDKGYHLLLETLETKFLDELRKMMAGEEDDKETVERAAKIVEVANSVTNSTRQGSLPTDTTL